MSGKGSSDGTDQTALHPQAQSEGTFEASDVGAIAEVGGPVEEATIQGASFLVERITPVPPLRGDARLPAPVHSFAMNDEATGAVQNPGSRSPLDQPAAVRVDPSGLAQAVPAMAPMTRQLDAPPDVDTAYVPLPGQPLPKAAPPPGDRPTVIASAVGDKNLNIIEKIKSSKNARLAVIAVGGLLSMGLTLLLFGPRTGPTQPPAPTVLADPGPAQPQTPPSERPPEVADPAKIEERDQLLERAILAVEAGRIDEALALFRRYAEEEPNPAAEFMVQLLQMQLSQTGKEP